MNNTPRYPQRVRNDLRFRELTVLRVERISAGFQRIVLGGEALDGFTSRGFDDHSKLFFPQPDAHFVPPTVTEEGIVWPEGSRPPSRDYTPLYDELRHELAIDFFIHDGGVASCWAYVCIQKVKIIMQSALKMANSMIVTVLVWRKDSCDSRRRNSSVSHLTLTRVVLIR